MENNEVPYIEIRLNLNTGEITFTDEKHEPLPQRSDPEKEGRSGSLPRELIDRLGGQIGNIESPPISLFWICTTGWKCGWVWDNYSKCWVWRCVPA